MNDLGDVGSYFVSKPFIASVVVVCIMMVLLTIIKKYLIKKVAYTTKDEQHQNTFIGVVFNILQYLVVLGGVVIILKLHGVNVTSIVTGLGIVATLVGLALQDTLKDIISGINIYNNNFYKVGDLVKYNDEICDVKYFSARVTKFVSIANGNTYTICNSTINAIEKVKNKTIILLTFDFEDDRETIAKCFNSTNEQMKDVKYYQGGIYAGIVDINDNGIKHGFEITCPGHKAMPIKIQFLTILFDEFKKAGISPSFSDERKILHLN